jgi:RecB family exonuclease
MKYLGTDDKYDSLKEAGLAMCEKWSEREIWHMTDGRIVLSLEEKKFLFIETSAGPIKLNYILDRFDKIGENKYEIVDYKSSIHNEKANSMRQLLQLRSSSSIPTLS